MIASFFHFLPSYICMALTVIYLVSFKVEKSPRMAVLTALYAIYFLADSAYYTLDVSAITWTVMDIISQFVALLVIPLTVDYLETEWNGDRPRHRFFWRYIPCVIMGIVSVILYIECGIGKISEFVEMLKESDILPTSTPTDLFLFYCNNIFGNRFVFIIQTLLAIIVLSILIHRRNGEENNRHFIVLCCLLMAAFVLCSVRALFGRFYMLGNQLLSSIISGLIAIVFIILGTILFPSAGMQETKVPNNEKENYRDSLLAKFLAYIENKRPYLSPDFTLAKAASDLGTNRTYLSILVNSQFGVPFRDYINNLRIEHAKEFILNNSDQRLEDAAIASGFYSGTQFSRKFKEKEGMTPNAWIRSKVKR